MVAHVDSDAAIVRNLVARRNLSAEAVGIEGRAFRWHVLQRHVTEDCANHGTAWSFYFSAANPAVL